MDRKMVKFIKEQYPPGTRIRLNSMHDPYAPITPGTEGIVDVVDDAERDGDKLKGLELYSKLAGYSQPEQAVQVNVAVGTSFSAVMESIEKGEQ